MTKRLIDKAKESRAGVVRDRQTKHPEDQLVELGVAWLEGRIGAAEICHALGRKTTSSAGAVQTALLAVRRAIVAGRVKLKV